MGVEGHSLGDPDVAGVNVSLVTASTRAALG
jgi:hypothetical protein